MPDFALYGVALTAIIVGLVKLFQDRFGLADDGADLIRAILAAFAFLLVKNVGLLEATVPNFELWVVNIGGFIGTFLTVLGYWSEVRRVGYRMQGR